MSTPPKEPHTSDGEGGERPLRERLRNATLAQPKNANKASGAAATLHPEPEKTQGKLHRKRSHEDVDATEHEPAQKSRHARKSKRSRENSPEDKIIEQTGKRKSSELERTDKSAATDVSETSSASASTTAATGNDKASKSDESPKSKRSKVDDKSDTVVEAASSVKSTVESEGNETKTATTTIPAGSGFANTSAASPFASLAASKSPSEQPQPSTSAFASSGFGALAGSSTSAFGALGQSKPLSSFASPTETPASGEVNTKPAPSAFGGKALGTSPFAAAGSSGFGLGSSGFGTLGNGLGGGFGGLGGSILTSFASSGTPGVIGSSKTGIKPFGAPEDEEDQSGEEEDNDAKAKSPKLVEEDKKDERFFEREIETGEETETTAYTCRAKLYRFVDKKEWKERGVGVLRLNVHDPKSGDGETEPKARLVMRADGSHNVILNTPIKKDLKFGTVTGDRPVSGYMYFVASIEINGETNIELLQLKARQQFALELWDHIADLQSQMS